jgi:membrane-associated phospholipid phosphatase
MTSDVVVANAGAQDAGYWSLRLVAAYLAAALFPLIRAAATAGPRAAVVCGIHLVVLAGVLTVLAARPRRDDVAAWIPLILWPALYAEVPTVIAGLGTAFHDMTVQRWDLALFGTQPSQRLAGALPNTGLSELVHVGYLSYYALIYVPPAVLFASGRRTDFARTVFAVTAVCLACLVAFVTFPVAGPRYLWGAPPDVPHGPARAFATWLLELGSARGTAFPSSHAAVAAAQSMMALRVQRPVGLVASFATLLLSVGAVYGGYHYAVDVLAGLSLGVIVVALVDRRKPSAQ